MRFRRHAGGSGLDAGLQTLKASAGRRFLRDLAFILVIGVLGFALSSSWISPGSLTASEHAVPRLIGLSEEDARSALIDLGFRTRVEGERESSGIARGAVVWQDPAPETVLPPGHTVLLVLSAGPAPIMVPDVVGLAQPFAQRIFETAGLRVGKVDTIGTGPEAGVVLATRPGPGHGRPRGARVDLMVSGGPRGGP